jgi:glycosyltransferase involved in cell wall biosynthesis
LTTRGPLRLVVDARPIDHPTARQRGIGRYTIGLIRGLHGIGIPVRAVVASAAEAAVVGPQLPGVDVSVHRPSVFDGEWADAWYIATGLFLHPLSADPIPAYVTRAGVRVAGVLYDVIPYRFPEQFLNVEPARRQAALRAPLARTCDVFLSISAFTAVTAAEQLALDAGRISVIGAGVDDRFLAEPRSPRDLLDGLVPTGTDKYVVAVTGKDPHKNNERLLQAWGMVDPPVRRGRHLVVVAAIDPGTRAQWESWAVAAGVADSVTFTGSVTDEQLIAVLQHAELAVMASLEEGFGLPVAEAAACGVPTICSSVSSLPEVLDEPAACFNPLDPRSIARRIERALTDPDDRVLLEVAARISAARWRWPAVGERVVEALSASTISIRSQTAPATTARRRRIMIVADATINFACVDALRAELAGRAEFEVVDAPKETAAIGVLMPVHDVDDLVTIIDPNRSDGVATRLARTYASHVWLPVQRESPAGTTLTGALHWAISIAASAATFVNLPPTAVVRDVSVADSDESLRLACVEVASLIVSCHPS